MGKPKGKTTAYSYFVQKQKEVFQADNPGGKIVFGDFMKECGAKWRELEASDKTPFEKKAKKDAVRYAREMDDYEPEDGSNKTKKRKKVLTQFFLGCTEFSYYFLVVGYTNLSGILGLFESLRM